MELACRLCGDGLYSCCDEHIYCSEACFNIDGQHIGLLEGLRGRSNFEDTVTNFILALADVRDAARLEYTRFPKLDGTMKGIEQRAALRTNIAKAEIKAAKTAYAIGTMLDSIRVSSKLGGKRKYSVEWNAMLVKWLPIWLNDAFDINKQELDLSAFFLQINAVMGGAAMGSFGLEISQALNIYLALPVESATTISAARSTLSKKVKKEAAGYDRIYKKLTDEGKKEAKK